MKKNIKGYLKDLSNNEITTFNTKAIKTKNKISYIIDKDRYTLNIISPHKLILIRENDEIKNIIYFDLNKTISSEYTLKESNITIEIDIKTLNIVIKDNIINIIYLVIDSQSKYEYNIDLE